MMDFDARKNGARRAVRERVSAIVDVELTNRCNARCVMCPRDKTPETGLMEKTTFRKIVARCAEYGRVETLVFCGLGEPLLHSRIVDFVGMAADAGLRPTIVTNGSLLTRDRAQALVNAGLRSVTISLGGFTRETYEHVHRGLKFREVCENVTNFIEVATKKADLNIQISPTEQSMREAKKISAFWRAKGARFCFFFPIAASRGAALSEQRLRELRTQEKSQGRTPRGCLSVDELFRPTRKDARIMRKRASFVCFPKDRVTFISWQGNYHLCCNDYEKKHSVGSVFDTSVEQAYLAKAGISVENNALCADCGLSGGDLQPRNLRFYLRVGAHLLGSRLASIRGRAVHPELMPVNPRKA